MELSNIVLVLLLTMSLLTWRLIANRRALDHQTVDALLGPLPERESGDLERADPGQVQSPAPGATTPTPVDPPSSSWGTEQVSEPMDLLGRLVGSGGTRFGLVGVSLGVGAVLFSVMRRRARRRRRIEQVRRGARRVVQVANSALSMARDRVGDLPDGLPIDLDRRSSTGGGVAVLAALGLLAALRGRQERESRAAEAKRLAAEAALAAQAASRRGWGGFRRRASTLAVSTDQAARPVVTRQINRALDLRPAISAAIVTGVVLAVRAVQRRGEAVVAAVS